MAASREQRNERGQCSFLCSREAKFITGHTLTIGARNTPTAACSPPHAIVAGHFDNQRFELLRTLRQMAV